MQITFVNKYRKKSAMSEGSKILMFILDPTIFWIPDPTIFWIPDPTETPGFGFATLQVTGAVTK